MKARAAAVAAAGIIGLAGAASDAVPSTQPDDRDDAHFPLHLAANPIDTAATSHRALQWPCNPTTRSPKWHPQYALGWDRGHCAYVSDCNSPGYASELDCCKFAYAGQLSGHCLSQLPNPPTLSPTETGGLDVYYPDYSTPWDEAHCINTRPKPSGWPSYSSMLECCQTAYAGQYSGKCISMLPSPPTTSPTTTDRDAGFWYPMYEQPWDRSGCSNQLPLPYRNINDRPNYATHAACCASAYGGQMSKACVCGGPTPRLGCPGVVKYTATVTSVTVTSTMTLGDICTPSDPAAEAALLASLEATLFDIVASGLGPGETLEEVTIVSLGNPPDCRRRLRRLARDLLLGTADVVFHVVIRRVCLENCQMGVAVGSAILAEVTSTLEDVALVQEALRESGNDVLQAVTVDALVESVLSDASSSVETIIGVPPLIPQETQSQITPRPTTPPTAAPTLEPSSTPSSMPSTFDVTSDEWMYAGHGVSFPSETEVVLQSDDPHPSQFGVVITRHAFNEPDIDFQVEYTQTAFLTDNGYESQIYIFFAPEGTYPDSLLQPDNDLNDFFALTAGYLRSKIFATADNTWFRYCGAGNADCGEPPSENEKYTELTLRLRRYNNVILPYYKTPDGNWVGPLASLDLPVSLQDVPLQFGFRVGKEWRSHHQFLVRATKLAGGPPLPIPTEGPTSSPTETRTWIVQATDYKEPVCPTTLDRSSVSGNLYEVRGIGGGGATSGLSFSPWNNLWFVGTDMGTLFRSTDAGRLWYPVSHNEAKYHSQLIVSTPVGYTSDPSIVLHASCHEDLADLYANGNAIRPCVAQRSVDSGVTWIPIDITGGSIVDSQGNAALDYVPMSWYGSLVANSGIVYCIFYGTGKIYRSSNDGLTWTSLNLPFDTTNNAVGLYFDESSVPPDRYIYFSTTHGVYMWKEGLESDAREIYTPSGGTLLQSFTGARSSTTLMLSFVDDDASACQGDHDRDCGYIYILREENLSTSAAETHTFTFTKTSQRAFRVESSRTDSDLLYVTGGRSWPSATGTQVWVGAYDSAQTAFEFTLKVRQYPIWQSDKLDYSGVGIDVGYWDAGYYRWAVQPNDSSVAGGSGNFFLHVTRNGGENWESPFTEYADGCNTGGERLKGRRWRSTGLEMTSVRWLQFNPYNPNYAFASVADIRMLRSDDGGETFEITGGVNTDPLFALNTVYDYDFAGIHTVFAVGGNFHDWPHEWYKNLRRGAGGVFVSFNSGDNWHRVGAEGSSNCDPDYYNDSSEPDCSADNDMVRQILSVHWDESVGGGTLYVGTQSAGVARLEGLNEIFASGTIEMMQDLRWEWINSGLGEETGRIVPEIKERNGKLYCLLTGNAPDFSNNEFVGIYQFDHASSTWNIKKGVVNRHPDIGVSYDLWAYPTSFDVDAQGNMWLVDIETNWNYLASGIWKSSDDGATWDRMHQFTFPYHITCVGNRVYASGARSISHIGNAGWGDGGAMYSDDEGLSWQKNEDIPLLSNLNSVVVDPADESQVFYTFFGGGMLHGPKP